jgi:hypothetical protein
MDDKEGEWKKAKDKSEEVVVAGPQARLFIRAPARSSGDALLK